MSYQETGQRNQLLKQCDHLVMTSNIKGHFSVQTAAMEGKNVINYS